MGFLSNLSLWFPLQAIPAPELRVRVNGNMVRDDQSIFGNEVGFSLNNKMAIFFAGRLGNRDGRVEPYGLKEKGICSFEFWKIGSVVPLIVVSVFKYVP